ncbi:MAG: anhydro-N-acetylmuramic acid kinase [candidate division Zixibacteria bacterium]|nr:anhydro-N-acetylmuramic acid kinase [candidate division Zixibacteria bacterium]
MSKAVCLKDKINKSNKLIIGLNSGTSADGIDVALVRITGDGPSSRVKYIAGKTYAFHHSLGLKIKKYAEPDFDSGRRWLELDVDLADHFSRAVLRLISSVGMKATGIDLIGSHGQTIRHLPSGKFGAMTYQLADPGRIAVKTGIITVGDFRIADAAAGGQGAPITPLVNAILFGRRGKRIGILNIGGIANITRITSNAKPYKIFGCDTGPGNMLVDYLARKLFKKPIDTDGKIAGSGTARKAVINPILARKFFVRKGPKSAGREDFGTDFGERFVELCRKKKLDKFDTMATAARLTIEAVKRCIKLNKLRFDELILTGGGVKNQYFKKELARLLPSTRLALVSDYGYPEDYLEAISFAVLANEALCSNRYLLKHATGARKAVVLGKICQS